MSYLKTCPDTFDIQFARDLLKQNRLPVNRENVLSAARFNVADLVKIDGTDCVLNAESVRNVLKIRAIAEGRKPLFNKEPKPVSLLYVFESEIVPYRDITKEYLFSTKDFRTLFLRTWSCTDQFNMVKLYIYDGIRYKGIVRPPSRHSPGEKYYEVYIGDEMYTFLDDSLMHLWLQTRFQYE